MKKNIILFGTLLISGMAFSQVGINTDIPKATLDVVGKATDTSSLDGIIAPRLTGDQLRAKTYTTDQTGTLVYVTTADTAPAGQTVNVTSIGYFYFDGAVWQKVSNGAAAPVNIYNANGTLTGHRTVNMDSKRLTFQGPNQNTIINNFSFDVEGITGAPYGYVGNVAVSSGVGNNGSRTKLNLQSFADGDVQILAGTGAASLIIGTHITNQPAPITFVTTGIPGGLGAERARISPQGLFGIGTTSPTEKLDNNGITRLRTLPLNGATNAINTQTDGSASATQNQTFTATRTVVADANGVLGTVAGLPATPVNIYNANGTLTSGRTLTQNGNALTFLGTNQSTSFYPNNGISQTGIAGGKRGSIVIASNDNNSDGVNSNMQLFQDPESMSQIIAGSDSRGLIIGTSYTTQPAPIIFMTSTGSNLVGAERMRITPTGNTGINISSPQAKLHVVKAASDLTPAIIEGCNEYADNAAATSAGLPVGGLYRTSTGVLMVRY